MGEVYLAWDHDLEREVAVKVLPDEAAESSDRIHRFVQEARAASALHHPNVAHVYEIGSHDGLRFIVMEILEGETLRQRLHRGAMSIDDSLSIGMQIAAALAAAHKAGIVHRDVKPENVIISPDGYAKVLDFGLAKFREFRGADAATLLQTRPGASMGTLGYMAPEQLSGSDVLPSADVFSVGVVLYEMISGRRPFEGTTATEIAGAILSKAPPPLTAQRRDSPPKLQAVIERALEKNAEDRYRDAGELLEELRSISRETMASAPRTSLRPKLSRPVVAAAAGVVLVAIAVASWWMAARSSAVRAAKESVERAEGLLAQRRLVEAFETATAAAAVLPDNERLREVISRSSDRMSINSNPPGATVFLQRFKDEAERWRAGTTPLITDRIPRADYVVTLEKEGYTLAARPVSMAPLYIRGDPRPRSSPELQVKLIEAAKVPPEMVPVEGGEYRLGGWSRPSDRAVVLRDFLIDRFEVSNRDFEEFVRAGGYRRRELWRHPFVDRGRRIRFEEAMARFHDTTGLPGPRSWSGGAPPTGRENHPVTDVTWYEAAAFAEWKGKKLPSIYQWEKAARYRGDPVGTILPWGVVGEGVDATERANFQGKDTEPVEGMPFGISPWGAHHMAGNVSEWCRNPKEPGFAFRGGSWNDPVYIFGVTGGYPPLHSSATLGFRCIKDLYPDAGDQGDFVLSASEVIPEYRPVGDRAFAEIRSRYEYARMPLNARVIETVAMPDWRREKIAYDVAGTTVFAYLYLPTGFERPLQVIHFAPAGDVDAGFRTLPASIESGLLRLHIRGGRAIFSVLLEGYAGRPRPPGSVEPDTRSAEYVDFVVKRTTELRRGLDYLETREDLDPSRIAFLGPSAGSFTGLVVTALETRYRSILFIGTGIRPSWISDAPAANRINFIPRISAPKLMLHGRYDENVPLKSQAEPMFRLLREPKRLEIFEGGHTAPRDVYIHAVAKWLDETLGPIKH
jgi:formylglycine-generating enzyme required for sulfatase activity/dienelactone hydrolase